MRGIGSVLVLVVSLSSCTLITSLLPSPAVPEAGSADGVGTAARFARPIGLAFDADDNLYVADSSNFNIRKVTPSAVVTTWAGGGVWGDAVGPSAQARFWYPSGVAATAEGVVYVADTLNYKIKKIEGGVVTVFAGSGEIGQDDGQGTAATFGALTDLLLDASGNLYVVDGNDSLRRIDPAGNVVTVATGFDFLEGIAMDAGGDLYGAEYGSDRILKITPAGVVTTFLDTDAGLEYPQAVAFGPDGSLFVSESGSRQIFRVTPAKVVTTFAGTPGGGYDDGQGTGAGFSFPEEIAVDSHGNLFVSDMYRIRKITPAGLVTTFAGSNGH